MWKTLGKKPKQLEEVPELPEELIYVWEWFREIFTGQTLSYTEIYHWSLVTGKSLKGWEAELIRSLDRIYWSVHNERYRKP